MDQEKKALLRSIAELETKVRIEKNKKQLDEQYFTRFFNRSQFALIAMLAPAFLIGWKGGKQIRGKTSRKKWLQYSLFTFLKIIRKFHKLR